MKKLVLLPLLVLLCGCGTKPIGSVGGECQLTHTPPYAVKGKTGYDQNWIDDTEEALVEGCNQPRPKVRPASLGTTYTVAGKTVPVPKPRKKHFWQK